MSSTDFAGEKFLQAVLPNYEQERFRLTLWMVAAAFAWIFVMPTLLASPAPEAAKKIIVLKKTRRDGTVAVETRTVGEGSDPLQGKTRKRLRATWTSAIGCISTLFLMLMKLSPNNYYTSRMVFQSPVFTKEECQYIIDMSQRAAQRSYESALIAPPIPVSESSPILERHSNRSLEGLLQEPIGWQKTRHYNYPTTDLNIVTDHFTVEDRTYLQNLLDRRLAPQLARIFGIPVTSIRANDMFVVRYDAGKRAHLTNHTDDGDISINILLNDEFRGGGTRFWNRILKTPFAHVQPTRVGQLLTHSALINHEGYHISQGLRMILVGFLSIDRMDPWTYQPTGMSVFSSWLSLPWMNVKFKEGYQLSMSRQSKAAAKRAEAGEPPVQSWKDHPYVKALFLDMRNLLMQTGDVLATHGVVNLVHESNATAYLRALDDQADAQQAKLAGNGKKSHSQQKASWFRGQGLSIDVDGTIDSMWASRSQNLNRYMEL